MQSEYRLLPLAALSKQVTKGRTSELCSAMFLSLWQNGPSSTSCISSGIGYWNMRHTWNMFRNTWILLIRGQGEFIRKFGPCYFRIPKIKILTSKRHSSTTIMRWIPPELNIMIGWSRHSGCALLYQSRHTPSRLPETPLWLIVMWCIFCLKSFYDVLNITLLHSY